MDQNSKILVTGASGFLGQYIIKGLHKNNFKNVIPTYYSNSESLDTSAIELNLNDIVSVENSLEGVDCVIHLAGMVSYNRKDKKKLYAMNQGCTRDLINACIFKNVKHFIYCSSASTLSKTNNPYNINEKENGDTLFFSNYAQSKYFGELEVLRGEAEGLNISILHPSLIMGVGNWKKGSCVIFKQIFDGLSFYPSGSIGLVHASDIAKAVCTIIEKDIWSSRFLLVAEAISYQHLFQKIASAFNVKGPSFKLNQSLAKFLVYLDSFRSFFLSQQQIITKETVTQVYQNFNYDNTKSVNQLALSYALIDDYIVEDCNQYVKMNKV